jgi:hypothetical protein
MCPKSRAIRKKGHDEGLNVPVIPGNPEKRSRWKASSLVIMQKHIFIQGGLVTHSLPLLLFSN